MKVDVEQHVTITIDLDLEEAEAIRQTLNAICDIEEGDLEDTDASYASWKTAKKIAPVLEEALIPKNWRKV
jgi:hypothetical protein